MPIDFDLNSTFNEGTSIEEAAAESIRSLEKLIQLSTSYAAGFREIAEQTVSNCNKMISAIKRTGHARFRQGPVASIEQPKAPVVAPEPEKSLINKNIDFAMTTTEFRQLQDFNSKFGPEFLSTAGTFSKNLGSGILNTAGNGSVAENPSRVVPYTFRDGSVTGEVAHGILHTVIEGSVTGNQSSSIIYAAGEGDGSVTGKRGPGILHTAVDGSVTGNQSSNFFDAAGEGDGSVTGKRSLGILQTAVEGRVTGNQSSNLIYAAGECDGSVARKRGDRTLHTVVEGSVTGNQSSSFLYAAGEGDGSVTGKRGPRILHTAVDGSVTGNQSSSIVYAAGEGDGSVTGKLGAGFFFTPAVDSSITKNQSFNIIFPPGKASVDGNLNGGNLYTAGDGSLTQNFASGNLLTAEAGPLSGVGEQGQKRPHSGKKMNCSASDKRAKLAGGSRIGDINQDDYSWRKYGQKEIKNAPPRSYYRCSTFPNCPAIKYVQCDSEDPSKLIKTYKGQHNHS